MNCVKHNFFEPGYQCKDCTIEDLRARVAELEAAAEAYKSEVATCHRNEGDRIRYREALVGTAASLAARWAAEGMSLGSTGQAWLPTGAPCPISTT